MKRIYHHKITLPVGMKFPSGIFTLNYRGMLLPETIDTKGLKIVECSLDYWGKLFTTTYRCGYDEQNDIVFTVDRLWNVLYSQVISREVEYWSQDWISDYSRF